MTFMSSLFARYADLVVRRKFLLSFLSLIAGFAVIAGIPNLTLDTDGRVFMDDQNPDKIMLDRFEQEYAKDDTLSIAIAPADGEVFTPKTLAVIEALTEDAWNLPYVRLVSSVTRFQNTYADGDIGLVVEDLVIDPFNVTQEQADKAKATALSRIELDRSLINRDASVTQISVIFRLPGLDLTREIPEIMEELIPLIEDNRAKHPDIDFYYTGSVALGHQFTVASQDDGATLTPAMLVAMLAVVGFLLRTVTGVLSVTIVAVLSALISLGSLGWAYIPLNSATAIAPLMIITLAVASTVHMLSSARQTMALTNDRREWARKAIADHGLAITIACLTTAIGFLSLNFSISPPFRQLGNMVAAGMLGIWVYTLTLLPTLIMILPSKQKANTAGIDSVMQRFGEFVIRNQRRLLLGIPVVIIAFSAGISSIKLEDDFLRYFDERYEMRQATDYFENNLGGLNVLEYALETGVESGINNVDYLAKVEAFTSFLRAQPEVSHVRSISDIVKQLNMNMNGDDPSFYRLPQSDEEVSQYLFLYELSLGYGMDLTDQINIDRSAIRVTAYVPNTTTASMIALDGRIQDWFQENAPELTSPVTGQTHVYTMISARDVPAMLQGTLLALVFISFIILLVLRDVKLGIISLVPNLIPAAMAFGLWGYSVGTVTLAVSIVVAMTLGIVVDDTVHFMLKYAEAKKRGETAENAVRYAFKSVGMALTVTSLGLVLGFIILGMSGFAVNRDLARLTAITLSFALFVDFLFLPPLLIWMDKMKNKQMPKKAVAAAVALAVILPLGLMSAPAMASAEKGLAIAQEQDKRDLGWGDFSVVGRMVLKNKAGKESVREFKTMTFEESDPALGDKSVIIFTRPRDVRGTSLLTHSNIEPEDDNQWLFLPALKRVKRISSSNRTGKFVSSEFSYEDLGSEEVDDNTYVWLEDLPCPGAESLTCAKVEITPKNKKSGYSKRIAFIDLDEYRNYQVDYFNRRGDLEKTLTFSDYRQYLGQYWRAHAMDMKNIQTGKSTTLEWDEYAFQSGLSVETFEPKSLPKLSRGK